MKIFIIKPIIGELNKENGFYVDIYDAPLTLKKEDTKMINEYAEKRGILHPYIIVEVPDDMTKSKFMTEEDFYKQQNK